MDLKIWLAFGIGFFLGACGMAALIGYMSLKVEQLRKDTERWWKENCYLYAAPHSKEFPRILIGYFQTSNSGAEQQHKEGL